MYANEFLTAVNAAFTQEAVPDHLPCRPPVNQEAFIQKVKSIQNFFVQSMTYFLSPDQVSSVEYAWHLINNPQECGHLRGFAERDYTLPGMLGRAMELLLWAATENIPISPEFVLFAGMTEPRDAYWDGFLFPEGDNGSTLVTNVLKIHFIRALQALPRTRLTLKAIQEIDEFRVIILNSYRRIPSLDVITNEIERVLIPCKDTKLTPFVVSTLSQLKRQNYTTLLELYQDTVRAAIAVIDSGQPLFEKIRTEDIPPVQLKEYEVLDTRIEYTKTWISGKNEASSPIITQAATKTQTAPECLPTHAVELRVNEHSRLSVPCFLIKQHGLIDKLAFPSSIQTLKFLQKAYGLPVYNPTLCYGAAANKLLKSKFFLLHIMMARYGNTILIEDSYRCYHVEKRIAAPKMEDIRPYLGQAVDTLPSQADIFTTLTLSE